MSTDDWAAKYYATTDDSTVIGPNVDVNGHINISPINVEDVCPLEQVESGWGTYDSYGNLAIHNEETKNYCIYKNTCKDRSKCIFKVDEEDG